MPADGITVRMEKINAGIQKAENAAMGIISSPCSILATASDSRMEQTVIMMLAFDSANSLSNRYDSAMPPISASDPSFSTHRELAEFARHRILAVLDEPDLVVKPTNSPGVLE